MTTVNQETDKGSRQFGALDLSDKNVIKNLILFRDDIDFSYGERIQRFYNDEKSSNALNQELLDTYTYLDELIIKSELKEEQVEIVKLLFEGNNYDDIAELSNTTSRTIKRRFDSICKIVTETDKRIYDIYLHRYKLSSTFKRCSKCNEDLPLTEGYYHKEKKGKDGFRKNCKKC